MMWEAAADNLLNDVKALIDGGADPNADIWVCCYSNIRVVLMNVIDGVQWLGEYYLVCLSPRIACVCVVCMCVYCVCVCVLCVCVLCVCVCVCCVCVCVK